jgi:hypothetical protein
MAAIDRRTGGVQGGPAADAPAARVEATANEHSRTAAAARSLTESRRALSRIALEIVIGFIGVYAAFGRSPTREHR